jgi:hypothetical protein
MSLNKYGFLVLSVLALSAGVRADSELDGPKAPAIIVSQLNPATNTITNYEVKAPVKTVSPDALGQLNDAQRKVEVEAFLKAAVRPENKISEEKAEQVRSELDHNGSTSATYYRWRGYRSGGYYGGNFNAYYGGYRYSYQAAWSYSNYSYYRGGYNYYPYYNRGYYPSYNNCYYTTYGNGYYGW